MIPETAASPLAHTLSAAAVEQLLALARRLAQPVDLRTMLAEVTAAACTVLEAERASVWLLDTATHELVLHVASDIADVRVPASHGIVGLCAAKCQPVRVEDCYADPRFDRSVDLRSGFHTRSLLALPLIDTQSRLIGVLQVLNRRDGPFLEADLPVAEALAAQCAVALSRAAATEALLAAEQLRRELAVARLVQTSALPRQWPTLPGYEMHATFDPAAETGGDGYDLALLPQGLLVMLADASGHGIAPALSVTQMQAMLRMAFHMGGQLDAAFAAVHERLCEVLPDGHFITAFIGLLDPQQHRLAYISGGQAPILHYVAAERSFRSFKANSFPMGLMPLPRRVAALELELAPGDLLVLASDGFLECEDAAGIAFGSAQLQAALLSRMNEPVAEMAAAVLTAVRRHQGSGAQADDMTLVLLRRLPAD